MYVVVIVALSMVGYFMVAFFKKRARDTAVQRLLGRADLREAMLSDKAIAALRNDVGSNLLHIAAQQNNLNAIKAIIEAKQIDIDEQTQFGMRALHFAVDVRSLEMVKCLLAGGASVNAKTHSGHTPLFSTASHSTSEIVEILIQSGADVHIKDTFGNTALCWAAGMGNLKLVEILLANGADPFSVDLSGGLKPFKGIAPTEFAKVAPAIVEAVEAKKRTS